MNELNLEQLKKTELDILVEIDGFCRAHGIQYSLCGGTLLGAVRHKGFIPWDDDIDLSMTRDNYERFLELFPRINSRYRLITYQNHPQYNYLFAKVVDTGTCLVEDHNLPVEGMGVFVDIFPVDALGDSREEAEALLKKVKFKRFLCVAACWKHFYINHNRGLLRQIPRLVFFLISRLMNVRKTNEWIEAQYPFDQRKKFWGCVCGSYEEREILEREVFTNYVDMEFEGRPFLVFRDYDAYLSSLYRNYMELPPKDKQVAHHTFHAYMKE